jgi:broad specificity phosphatase PhoE
MAEMVPLVLLARHGETAWSLTGQHTGRNDLCLTERGEQQARKLGLRLQGSSYDSVWTSPLQRARRTCELAGFSPVAQVDPDLAEWHYGAYEGLTLRAIRESRPDWQILRDGCPEGESPDDLIRRADRCVARLRQAGERVLVFSHGHFLRVLAARWCQLPLTTMSFFQLGTAALCGLGYESDRIQPTVRFWNDDRHLADSAPNSSSR